MQAPNSNDVFYVTYSKWKIWGYAILCWLVACIPLIPLVLFIWETMTGESSFESEYSTLLILCSLIFLFFAAIPFLFLRRLNKPIAILTRAEFSGTKNLRPLSFAWSSNTIMYYIKGSMVLANPVSEQSYKSKLWGGHKAAVMIYNRFAKQKRQEVLEAVNRLAPYSVEQTTLWGSVKH